MHELGATAATTKVRNKPTARKVKETPWLGKPNKWNPLKEKAPEPKPHAQPGLVGLAGKTPLKRQTNLSGRAPSQDNSHPVLDLPTFRGPTVTKENHKA